MARVKCTCGRVYDLPAEHVGARVTCKACGRSFVATVAESPDVAEREQRPPAPATPRLGQLAIERALVSQEHVELCARVQEQLVRQGKSKKRLGEIMVEKGFMSVAEVLDVLKIQGRQIMVCPGCGARFNVEKFEPGSKYRCKKCKTLLNVPVRLESVGVDTTIFGPKPIDPEGDTIYPEQADGTKHSGETRT